MSDEPLDIEFNDEDVKFSCRINLPFSFMILRSYLFDDPNDISFIKSLKLCDKWDISGGKSGSKFYMTNDEKLVLKHISKIEYKCFLQFGKKYIEYIILSITEQRPTLLTKILGIYRVSVFQGSTRKSNGFYIVMENLFRNLKYDALYDLKGCSRKNINQKGKICVQLDDDMAYRCAEFPIYVTSGHLSNMHRALRRDLYFLEGNSLIDYSLVVAMDYNGKTIQVGLIDFLRKFTWDKRLESVVKSSIMIGTGLGRTPTIVPPSEYRVRFLESVKLYFSPIPSYWSYIESYLYGAGHYSYYINSEENEKFVPYPLERRFTFYNIFAEGSLPYIRNK